MCGKGIDGRINRYCVKNSLRVMGLGLGLYWFRIKVRVRVSS